MAESDVLPPDPNIPSDDLSWRPLRLLCVYRIVVAVLVFGGFAVTIALDTAPGVPQPVLFLYTASGYLATGFILLGLAVARRLPFAVQVCVGTVADIAAISLLIHGSGGIEAGLGVLMVVAVAGGSLLVGARLGSFFAALATLSLLAEHAASRAIGLGDADGYTRVGFVGIGIFATALAGAYLARRARESEALATRRGIDVENLEALSAHIVQRMDTGVVALDAGGSIRLVNSTARQLLGPLVAARGARLEQASPGLAAAFAAWRDTWEAQEAPITDAAGTAEFVPRFQPLGPGGKSGTLIFLENVTQMRAQVQQAKLASLGRLTASIAHEIRNPLGAMLQAAQLLDEADYLERGERRLVEIIGKQGRRMNKTIENVLQLSRRAPPQREGIDLAEWLPAVIEEWHQAQPTGDPSLRVVTDIAPVRALFDPGHLQQVVDNLLRNARQHAGREGEPPTVSIRTRAVDDRRGTLEVGDNGPGIDPQVRNHLFEPFATGSRSGTGLGLYLARELCEANQARITLNHETETGACFRIVFTRPAPEGTH